MIAESPLKSGMLLMAFAGVTVWAHFKRMPLAVESSRLAARIDQLQPSDIELSRASMESAYDKRYIFAVMALCQEATEIPPFDCSRMVVRQKGRDGSMFYLPSGNHKLVVTAKWRSCQPGTRAVDAWYPVDGDENRKSWGVELQGNQGYFCQWWQDESSGTLGWRLTSNIDSFLPVSHALPLQGLKQTDLSWTNGGTAMRFPNALMNDDHADRPSASVRLGHWDRIGSNQGETWQIRFAAEIVSDAPAVVCAESREWYEEANGIEAVGRYLGDGRFLLIEE